MSEHKHTPGPWSLPHFARPDVNCECGYVLTGDMFGAVCTVHASGEGDDWQAHGDNPKFEEAVANANLISAAPDLLEACEAALKAFDGSNIRIALEHAGAVGMLRDAISKAAGGPN